MSGHYDDATGLIKVSWTKVRTSEECRQKAWLLADGRRSPLSDVGIFLKGNVVDQACRRWLEMAEPPRGWMAERVDEIMDELEAKVKAEEQGVVRWKHRDDREEARQFCRVAALRLEDILRQLVIRHEYQPAVRFSAPMNIPGLEEGTSAKILLVGEMDIMCRERAPLLDITTDPDPIMLTIPRDKLRVWDLKVTKDAQYWRKTMAQLTFYDIACLCMDLGPTDMVGLLQPMVEGEPVKWWRVGDEDRTQMFNRIVSVAHGIMRGDKSPKAGSEGCSYCEVRHACEKYGTEPGTNRVPLFKLQVGSKDMAEMAPGYDPDEILEDPDAHPVHKVYAAINIGIRDRGESWSKCVNCGDPYQLTPQWGNSTVCSPECEGEFAASLGLEPTGAGTYRSVREPDDFRLGGSADDGSDWDEDFGRYDFPNLRNPRER